MRLPGISRSLPVMGPRGRDPEPPRPEVGRSEDELRVLDALRSVIDPEVGLDVVTMGLVYDVAVTDGAARVVHTLTIQGCPMEAHITAGLRAAAAAVEGVRSVETELVWDPPWHPGMIRDGAL